MSEQQTTEPVNSRPVQIWTNHPLIISLAPAIEQPICAPGPQVNSRARAQIQYRNLRRELFGPVWLFDIKMAAGNLREQLHDPKNKPREKPIRIIENDSDPRQQRRGDEREQCNRENEKGNRDDH